MNLHTHLFFTTFIVLVFTNSPEATLLAAFGSLIPDLDREYWFMKRKTFREEQLHRSLFHNMSLIFIAYLICPWIALGIFLHSLLDAFTTVKDRGVEWLYPFSRLVKRGRYGYGCELKSGVCNIKIIEQPIDPGQRVYFYQEDPKELTKLSDPDLAVPKPIPWRRTYGPALNGQMLDQSVFISSLAATILYIAFKPSLLNAFLNCITSNIFLLLLSSSTISLLYISGEIGRRVRSKKLLTLLLVAGLAFLSLTLLNITQYYSIQWSYAQSFLTLFAGIFATSMLITWKITTRSNKRAFV